METPGIAPADRYPSASPPESSTRGVTGSARAIALIGGAQALVLVGGLVRWKIAALYLGPSGVGIAGVIDQIAVVVLQLGSLNMPTVALRFLAIARSSGGPAFGRLYRGFMAIVLAGCAATAACAALLFFVRPALVADELSPYSAAVFIALAIVPFTAAVNLLRNVLSALDRHQDMARAMIASALLTAVASLIGVRAGGLAGLYIASLVATLAIAMVLYVSVARDPRVESSGGGASMAALREHPAALRFAAALYTVGFTVPLAYSVVRSTVLDSLGSEAAGYLAASYTIATGARISFAQASIQFLLPQASRVAPKPVRANEVAVYLHTLAVAMALVALPVALFPREVLLVLFSPRFTAAVSFVGLFLLAELMMAFGDAYRTLLIGFDDMAGYVATTMTAPLAVMAGVVLVVPRYGIIGAGWVQICAAVVALAMALARLKSRHGTAPDPRALLYYAVMIAIIGAATAAGEIAPGPSASARLGKVLLGVLLGALAIALLPPAERAALFRFFPLPSRLTQRFRTGRSRPEP